MARAKRLYRIELIGMALSVRHFQSRTYANSWARRVARKWPDIRVRLLESEPIVWKDETPIFDTNTQGTES